MPAGSDTLNALLDRLHWSSHALAEALGVRVQSVSRWRQGAPGHPVPGEVIEWLEALVACHSKHPPPERPEKPLQAPGVADD